LSIGRDRLEVDEAKAESIAKAKASRGSRSGMSLLRNHGRNPNVIGAAGCIWRPLSFFDASLTRTLKAQLLGKPGFRGVILGHARGKTRGLNSAQLARGFGPCDEWWPIIRSANVDVDRSGPCPDDRWPTRGTT
jgi:hypothetical protein